MMVRRTVVVLGASGYIGRRIVAALAASAWASPIAVSRHVDRVDFPLQVRKLALDASDAAALAQLVTSAAAVVSCIAGTAHDILRSGEALLRVSARCTTPPQVVYLSSMAAYGSARGMVDEEHPLLGDLDDYSAAKAAVDRLAASYPFTLRLRPGIVYGPESPWWTDRIGRLLLAGRLGDLGEAGVGVCNLVHVDDVVRAVLSALEPPARASGAFNLGSSTPPTWNAYFSQYARALEAPMQRISRARLRFELTLYGPLLKLATAAFGENGLLRDRPPIRPWLIKLCGHDIRLNVARAEQELGMRWRPLTDGLEESAGWLRAAVQAAPSVPRR
jgi:2-alkyl-3-oxoalkanoate reductase